MEEKRRWNYSWRGIKQWEVIFCILTWIVMFVFLPQESRMGWGIVGVLLGVLIIKSYGSGMDYNSHELLIYRFGKKKATYSWNEVKEIQVVSKRTGILWRKHYALGFFIYDEAKEKELFLGVSPTVRFKRLERELLNLGIKIPTLEEKVNVQRLTEEEQFRCVKALSKKL